jgi:hypothetical protein
MNVMAAAVRITVFLSHEKLRHDTIGAKWVKTNCEAGGAINTMSAHYPILVCLGSLVCVIGAPIVGSALAWFFAGGRRASGQDAAPVSDGT